MNHFLARVVEPRHEAAANVLSAVPPVAAVGSSAFGVPLSDLAIIGGLLVLLLQAAYWLVRIYFRIARGRAAMRAGLPPPDTSDRAVL